MDYNYIFLGITCLLCGWILGYRRMSGDSLIIHHLEGSDRIFLKGKLGDEDMTGKYQKIYPYSPQPLKALTSGEGE